MGFAAGRKRFIRDTQNLAARLRVITFVCEQCGLWGRGAQKPAQCLECGSMAFLRFDSKAEATRWGTLRMLEQRGQISMLRRQVRFPLMTVNPNTRQTVTVGHYVADFTYLENGLAVVEDLKGDAMTDLAAWKCRHMEAQGVPVKLVKA